MRYFRKIMGSDSMRARMTVFVTLIIFVSTAVLSIASYVIYSKVLVKSMYNNTVEMQQQVQEYVDAQLTSVGNSIQILSLNKDVQDYLKNDAAKHPGKRLSLENSVRALFQQYSDTYPDYLNIIISSEKGQYLSNDSYRIQRTPLSNETWYRSAVKTDGTAYTGYHIGRNIRSWKKYSAMSYISVSRAVRDPDTGKVLGVIMIDWDLNNVSQQINKITFGQTGFVYIMDADGKILYSPENQIVNRIRPQWFLENDYNDRCTILGRQYTLIYNRSKVTGLTTIGVFDDGKTIQGVRYIQEVSLMIALLTLLIGNIWAFAFSASFTRPIQKLSRLMKKVQDGDFSVRFTDPAKGEIKQLGDTFNMMTDKTDKLIKLVYQEQQRKREAEMQMLEAQIKPHFLYNTLDTIQWMARKYQAMDITDLVVTLAHFFRISLNRGGEKLSLADEFSMVESYLNIQKYRYEDMFEYHISCEEELKKCEVIKLIIQPIAENALYHGIKESDNDHGDIWISATAESEHTLLIVVEDNGAGMDEAKCNELNQLLREGKTQQETKAYGILNVNDRIKIAYGNEYGLTFQRREAGGTRVEIRVKLCRRGDQL